MQAIVPVSRFVFTRLFFLYIFLNPLFSHAQSSPTNRANPQLSIADWREDLHFLAAQMRLKHRSLFHTMTEAQFDNAVASLDSDLPNLNSDQIFVRFAQLTAMVQDGHSGFDLLPIPANEMNRIPVHFVRYADGIYIRAAAPAYADIVGGKLLEVGGVPWHEAIQRLDSLQSHDPGNNGEQLAWTAKALLNYPRVLHGLGLSDSSDGADFVIEKEGKSRTLRMRASAPLGTWYLDSEPDGWIDARPKTVTAPLSMQHREKHYWFTYLPERHAVYFQFNLVIDGEGETLAQFSSRLAKAIQQPEVQRLVIDVRNNTGGDNTLLRPLLAAIFRSPVDRHGGIYVITGPTTFSACQNFVNRLENYADVIFVGQPTAENVNFYGDPAGITLPHSHLEAAVSQLWWQDEDPRDKRAATMPDAAFESTFRDYLTGADPALQFALTAATPLTIEESLEQALPQGLEGTKGEYASYLADPLHKYLSNPERRINSLGYKLLGEKRVADAIVIFEVNAQVHPNSSNAYDSLGEAYAAANDKQHAINAYRKSFQLNSENANAKRMIEQLQGPGN